MKDVQCYELFGGIALKNHAFSFSLKDLGVHFDPKLNFGHYIFEITHKATKILGILKRTFLFLNKKHYYYYISP